MQRGNYADNLSGNRLGTVGIGQAVIQWAISQVIGQATRQAIVQWARN